MSFAPAMAASASVTSPVTNRAAAFAIEGNHLGEGFEAAFTGHCGAGAPFGLEGQIDVLEHVGFRGLVDARAQFIGKCACGFNHAENIFLAFLKLGEILIECGDVAYLHFVEAAGVFFAVAAYKRNGRSLVEESDCGLDSPFGKSQASGDFLVYIHFRSFKVMIVISGVAPMRDGNPTVPAPMFTYRYWPLLSE